jgi:ribosomal protein S27AE
MKKCFKCGIEKELSGFYKHPAMKDGHVNKCKECNKNDVGEHRLKNIEKIRKYDRDRGNRQTSEYLKEWRENNPKKYKAHSKVAYEIKAGNLVPESCEECGDEKTVAHHDDYDRPLKVRWLCQAHHKQWHAENGEGKNGK